MGNKRIKPQKHWKDRKHAYMVTLDHVTHKKLNEIGEGNRSLGVRLAVAAWVQQSRKEG